MNWKFSAEIKQHMDGEACISSRNAGDRDYRSFKADLAEVQKQLEPYADVNNCKTYSEMDENERKMVVSYAGFLKKWRVGVIGDKIRFSCGVVEGCIDGKEHANGMVQLIVMMELMGIKCDFSGDYLKS